MKKLLLTLGLALVTFSSNHPFGSTLFDFSFTGNSTVSGDPLQPFSGMGTFTATEVGLTNQYKVTAVTGTTYGQTITGIIKVGGYGFNDNLLFYNQGDASATLDNSGVSYLIANGVNVNLFHSASGPIDIQQVFGFPGFLVSEQQSGNVTITPRVAVTPEPSSLILLGTGVLSAAGILRRKIKTQ